jgi:hypothetical protein
VAVCGPTFRYSNMAPLACGTSYLDSSTDMGPG